MAKYLITVTETYRWQVSDGTSNMNSMSQTAAQANSRDFQVGTWDVAEMPQQQQPVSQARADRLAKSWSNLTYEQQQDRLSRTAWLKDALAKRGITVKTQPTQTTPYQLTRWSSGQASTSSPTCPTRLRHPPSATATGQPSRASRRLRDIPYIYNKGCHTDCLYCCV